MRRLLLLLLVWMPPQAMAEIKVTGPVQTEPGAPISWRVMGLPADGVVHLRPKVGLDTYAWNPVAGRIVFVSDVQGPRTLILYSPTAGLKLVDFQVGQMPNPPPPVPPLPPPPPPGEIIIVVVEETSERVVSKGRDDLTTILVLQKYLTGQKIRWHVVDQNVVEETGKVPQNLVKALAAAARIGLPTLVVCDDSFGVVDAKPLPANGQAAIGIVKRYQVK